MRQRRDIAVDVGMIARCAQRVAVLNIQVTVDVHSTGDLFVTFLLFMKIVQ